jgi:putative MATE family efflux protein
MSRQQTTKPFAAKFVSGSIMKHIWVMTTTSAIGLVCVFLVDFVDILFLSMLGDNEIVAGIGFAATLSFFTLSIGIGVTISVGALVSRSIGQGNDQQAKAYVTNITALTLVVTSFLALILWLNLSSLLQLFGASGSNLHFGTLYLQIILPSFPLLAAGMALSSALRAVGDAKLSLVATLAGSIVNAVLDPIFIFVLDMGVEGAATSSVLARFAVLAVAIYGTIYKHHLISPFKWQQFTSDLNAIYKIAVPAILTNMATPLGNAIVIKVMAQYSASYIAGFAIIGRLSMVCFALIFSLSGAIAPIFGQNYGAFNQQRIQQTLKDSLKFNAIYVMLVSTLLYLVQDAIISLFSLQGDAATLVTLFCSGIAFLFVFNGVQFIANSAFNNLGKPIYSTIINIGRSTLGTIPFVIIGGQLGGAEGVLIGQAVGGMVFAVGSLFLVFRHIDRLKKKA